MAVSNCVTKSQNSPKIYRHNLYKSIIIYEISSIFFLLRVLEILMKYDELIVITYAISIFCIISHIRFQFFTSLQNSSFSFATIQFSIFKNHVQKREEEQKKAEKERKILLIVIIIYASQPRNCLKDKLTLTAVAYTWKKKQGKGSHRTKKKEMKRQIYPEQ